MKAYEISLPIKVGVEMTSTRMSFRQSFADAGGKAMRNLKKF